ncbi:ribosome biogenesis GTPase YlqF [Ligilactobacillus saerimneri]|uniref:Ribosome biogenesis GTPase A n=1 Tax=Ligilactobacillus saerimneri TaxID=228229 RepID=A0A7H9EKJ8_9LACO|nr:ribosome biogenesis GTPase YlqF [Ligilactobacillus saerimneri]QLL77909.1 ribosome biogenesis GTPase YlqF [Ligilactobacillus saerimneri]
MAVIQWYPGHMAKALRQVKDNLKAVDIVLELVDARIPDSSWNPQLTEVIEQKPRIVVLTKMDLADPAMTQKWINYYEQNGIPALAVNSNANSLKVIEKKIIAVLGDNNKKKAEKGIKTKRSRVMCVGIPNVGKSTLLNHLAKRRIAQVGNRPGVTKAQQWIKVGNTLQLLDTPGILWPKFEDPLVGKKLALTGAIKDTLYAKDDVALYALEHFVAHNPQALMDRYRVTNDQINDTTVELLLAITANMGFKDDYERASERLIFDIRKGKLGRYTLDEIPQPVEEQE